MSGLSCDRGCAIELAPGLLEVKRIKQVSTLVALIASCVLVATERALSLDEAVSQESLMGLAVWLDSRSLLEEAVLVELGEDVLCDLGLLVGGSPAEDVEANVEPFIDLCVQLVILVAELLWCALFLDSLGLGCRAVLVCSADEEGGKSASLAVSVSCQSCWSHLSGICETHLEKTSADRTLPMMLPR